MYGSTETNRQAKAAHARNNPLPTETSIPRGTGGIVWTVKELMSSAFFIITVQITDPMSKKRLPRMAKTDDNKKANVR